MINKQKLFLGVAITAFFSLLHFGLSCSYHYITYVGGAESLFEFETWSYPFKRKVTGVNFTMIFIGLFIAVMNSIEAEKLEINKAVK